MFEMECSHSFCQTCWRRVLERKIIQDVEASYIECPSFSCHLIIPDDVVMEFVLQPWVRNLYCAKNINCFVKSNPLISWCTGPGCTNAIVVNKAGSELRVVTCVCGQVFCHTCSNPAHMPLSCHLVKKWQSMLNGEFKILTEAESREKACLQCGGIIIKDAGSNFIKCTNIECTAIICWTCFCHVEGYGNPNSLETRHKCLTFSQVFGKLAGSDSFLKKLKAIPGSARSMLSPSKMKAKDRNDQLLFFVSRYLKQVRSIEFERTLCDSVISNLGDANQRVSWIMDEFLKKTTQILENSRNKLMYTYVFLYFVEKNSNSQKLEGLIGNLELSTKRLSYLLDRTEHWGEGLDVLKHKVQLEADECESQVGKILKCVELGYKGNEWVFNTAKN